MYSLRKKITCDLTNLIKSFFKLIKDKYINMANLLEIYTEKISQS